MDAPKCRVCGEKHWASEPHKFKEAVGSSEDVIKALKAKIRELEQRLSERDKYVPKAGMSEARKVYMREYMRKRRAK